MKHTLLFLFMLAFGFSAISQSKKYEPTLKDSKPNQIKHLISYDQINAQSSEAPKKDASQSKGMEKIPFTSSANIYSVISVDQSVLTVDQDLGAIAHFARAGGNYGGSGDELRINTTTFDDYTSWNETVITPESGKNVRYPSGGILSFSGSASLDDAYAAFSGPITGGSGWTHNFTGSVKLDGTGSNEAITYESLPSGTYFAHANSNLTVCDDSTVHVAGDIFSGTSADYYWSSGLLYNGKFNAATNEIDWEPLEQMNHNFAIDSSDMTPAASGTSTAWNEDGSVGYYIFRGRDSVNDTRAFQPIVYKSTNQGDTWNQEPVFDFSTLPSITDYLWPTIADTTVTKAFFSTMEPVVDNQGMLHIFSLIQGSYSDHKDSLGYTYLWEPHKLFHVYMLPGGGWEAELINVMNTFDVTADDQLFGSGGDAMGWSHRINASRTEDGEKIFVVWGDTDSSLATQNGDGFLINSAPDIYAAGKDLADNTTYPVTSFTNGTNFWGDNFFHYASDITYVDQDNNLIIPVSTVDIGNTPLDEITHNLLMTVGYGTTINTEEFEGNLGLTVNQNFPNPFNDRTNISVDLEKGANLQLEVFNMIGQKVYQEDKGNVSPGSYNFMILADQMKPGIYFYRVKAGERTRTKKMIVQ
ncbi:MAG: T9SS type A sorting domain-containing protein [Bacteroidota bacterium]